MTGLTAALRPLRKPALALVAAAGLVASAGGTGPLPAAVDGRAPIVPGQAVLTLLAHGSGPALGAGPGASGLLIEPGERPQHRLIGGGDPHQPAKASPLFSPGRGAVLRGGGAASGVVARSRAAIRSVPSTGPPSFPS